jgi:hypothetical protein
VVALIVSPVVALAGPWHQLGTACPAGALMPPRSASLIASGSHR